MNDLIDRRLMDEGGDGDVDRREQCGSQSRDLHVVPVSVARVTTPLGEDERDAMAAAVRWASSKWRAQLLLYLSAYWAYSNAGMPRESVGRNGTSAASPEPDYCCSE